MALLLQFTDLHWFADPAADYRGMVTRGSFAAVVAAARAAHPDPAALLMSGDLVDDGAPNAYAELAVELASFGVPALCIPGNHDAPTALAALTAHPHMRVGGQHRVGAWQVCLLNTFIPDDACGRIAPPQLAALDRALAREPVRPALVALHHHPVPVGSRWLDGVALLEPERLFEVIDRHPQVRAVVFGHVHQEFDGARGAVRILGTPSTCVQFKARSDDFATDPTLAPGYRWLELGDDGRLATGVGRASLPR
jgi:Icc protein